MDPDGPFRLHLRWDYRYFGQDQALGIAKNPALRIRRLNVAFLGVKAATRTGDFGVRGQDPQLDRLVATCSDIAGGRFHPIVERVRLGESRAVLFNAPSPNVLVGIDRPGLGPMVHGRLEVGGYPLLGFVANAITDSQAEMRVTVTPVLLKKYVLVDLQEITYNYQLS